MDVAQLHDTMESYVGRGEFPGIVTLVARDDEVQVGTFGIMDLESRTPARQDNIFRIASMTKPVTAVAMLMLIEEGAVSLDDPVDRWLPELANRRVLRRIDGPVDDTVPADRAITVGDLMTMRAGYGVVMDPAGPFPIQRLLEERGLAPGAAVSPLSYDEWMARFTDIPLLHQPGEEWHYHTASDMLGILIARLTGEPLSAFFRERILGPLNMRDTGFFVPEEKLDRLPTAYVAEGSSTDLQVLDPARGGMFSRPPVFESGAGGLVSTVDDYLRFARMLLNGGEDDGTRYLSSASVRSMTTDHLTRAQKDRSPFFPGFWDHRGWGYGVDVAISAGDASPVAGHYGWDGGYGTAWRNHPALGVTAIVMTQRMYSEPVIRMMDDFFRIAFGTTVPG